MILDSSPTREKKFQGTSKEEKEVFLREDFQNPIQ